MKMTLPRFLFVALALLSVFSPTYAAPKVESLGNGIYTITVSANHKFTRNTEKLKAQATAAATEFCTQEHKQLEIVSVDESKPMYLVGEMAKVTLTFKAVEPGAPPAAAIATSFATTVGPASPGTNQALYQDLLRLDDLRKKGILTEDEFATEKKKLLEKSH